jgi:sensor histidine kinase YesM
MPAPASILNPAPPLITLRASLPVLLQHALMVAGFCVVIALGLWWLRASVPLPIQLVYSFSGGMLTWAIIDLGRFFIDIRSPYHFPRGWRAIALVVAGCAIGHVLGTFIGDAYSGKSSWEIFQDRPRMLVNFFLLSIVTGAAISFFFYANGKAYYLRSELQASQRQASEAQLKLLQSQLEPHMLFNTLANLRALIATDPQRATMMLDSLNNYLRSTLSASRATLHPLSAEFDRLKDYLDLMSIRMGPRLAYTLTLPPELATHPVPPLLLQPLVENAIKHGLEPTVAGGKVTVTASAVGGVLTLEVCDTGAGLPPPDASDSPDAAKGFGLAQVRERLHSVYGNAGALELVAAYAGSTRATVRLPMKNGV